MAGEARFSREMAAARGLNGDPAQARRDSPDPGRRHDGRGHIVLLPSSIFRAARAARLLNEPRASDSIDLLHMTFTGLQLHAPRVKAAYPAQGGRPTYSAISGGTTEELDRELWFHAAESRGAAIASAVAD